MVGMVGAVGVSTQLILVLAVCLIIIIIRVALSGLQALARPGQAPFLLHIARSCRGGAWHWPCLLVLLW